MPTETAEIRKLRNGSIAVFDKSSKSLFLIPEVLATKFRETGGDLKAAESLAANPKVVKLTKSALQTISEAMSALLMLG